VQGLAYKKAKEDATQGILYLHRRFDLTAFLEREGFATESPALPAAAVIGVFRTKYGNYTRNVFAKVLQLKALKPTILELAEAVSTLRKSLRLKAKEEEEDVEEGGDALTRQAVREAARSRLDGLSRVGQKASLVLGAFANYPLSLSFLKDKFEAVEVLVTFATETFLTSLDQLSPQAIGPYPRDFISRRAAYFQLSLALHILAAELGKRGQAATALSSIHVDLPTAALRALGEHSVTQMNLISALEKQGKLCLIAAKVHAGASSPGLASALGSSASEGVGQMASGASGASGGAGYIVGGSGAGGSSASRGPVTADDVRHAYVDRLVKDKVKDGVPLTEAHFQAIANQANGVQGPKKARNK
jgi:hypothetical protein